MAGNEEINGRDPDVIALELLDVLDGAGSDDRLQRIIGLRDELQAALTKLFGDDALEYDEYDAIFAHASSVITPKKTPTLRPKPNSSRNKEVVDLRKIIRERNRFLAEKRLGRNV